MYLQLFMLKAKNGDRANRCYETDLLEWLSQADEYRMLFRPPIYYGIYAVNRRVSKEMWS